ncbi:hypothetical protein ACG2LH_14880 [Zhouia sp. PK063]|uniref:hypothetical protein n=1 Tax=Zhouia sp. PK063 TaxID=3373602 RepID=UPI0037B04446
MKKYLILLFVLFILISCETKRNIELARVTTPAIKDVTDISQAFIFYMPNKKDSVELNKNNLISTTNWIVHVDKRLKLYQALPSIKLLQEKHSANSPHKNENAKNYFSAANANTKQLNFIDFTKVNYLTSIKDSSYLSIVFNAKNKVKFNTQTIVLDSLPTLLKLADTTTTKQKLIISFNDQINFQQYISDLEILLNTPLKNIEISEKQEIISTRKK